MKRIYVAGAGGMLGSSLHEVLSLRNDFIVEYSDLVPSEDWLAQLDFRDFQGYRQAVAAFNPDILIHLGAHTDLEYCEKYPDDAYLTNSVAVSYASNIARSRNIGLVYISTAGVFDGLKDFYDDWDTPNPISVYGRSKYMGEIEALRWPRALVCRAGWMMGGYEKDKKFVSKILRQLKDGCKDIMAVDDKFGSPTYTVNFAKMLVDLIDLDRTGCYNLTGTVGLQGPSRYEVATEIVHLLNLSDIISVRNVSSDYFKRDYFASRPRSEILSPYKATLEGVYLTNRWQDDLRNYLGEWKLRGLL
jgi:dTDP-4-dehydrorhamnose reductase